MKKRILLILSLVLAAFNSDFAQNRKIVTNSDLEKYRQQRLKAEKDYRENYKKLGMPSPEELERMESERQRRLKEFSQRAEIEKARNEDYLRARTGELKFQIAAIDAQINYLRASIGGNQSVYSGGTVSSTYFYNDGSVIVGGSSYGKDRNFGRNTSRFVVRGNLSANGARSSRPPISSYRNRRYGGGYFTPFIYNNGYYAQDDLPSRLSYLEQERAGLSAEWQALEEEARRAGVRLD